MVSLAQSEAEEGTFSITSAFFSEHLPSENISAAEDRSDADEMAAAADPGSAQNVGHKLGNKRTLFFLDQIKTGCG